MNDSNEKSKHKHKVRLRVFLTSIILLVLLFVFMFVHLSWERVSRKNISFVVSKLNHEIVNGISNQVDALFTNGDITQRLIQQSFSEGIVHIYDTKKREKFFLTLLRSNENLSWVTVGFPNGNFLGAQRLNQDKLRITFREWRDDENIAYGRKDTYQIDADGLHFIGSNLAKEKFNVKTRNWYKNAISQEGSVWTEVYIFFTSKMPGITNSLALRKNSKLLGVITVDMELASIANYLSKLKVSETGSAFIMNQKQEIIALQDPTIDTFRVDGSVGKEKPRLKLLQEIDHPHLRLANQALNDSLINVDEIDAKRELRFSNPKTGESYYLTFTPIEHFGWLAVTVIPESDFLHAIHDNNKMLLAIFIIILCSVIVLAHLLTTYFISNPLLVVTSQLKHLQNFDLQKDHYRASTIFEIDYLSLAMDRLQQRMDAFSKYMSIDLVRTVFAEGIEPKLGVECKPISVFIIDIQDYINVYKNTENDFVSHFGEYLQEISGQIVLQKGTIDKFMGSLFRAYWGAPIEDSQHAVRACRSALRIQVLLDTLRTRWNQYGKPPLRSTIAINTGPTFVGNVGHEEWMDYTVIGPTVLKTNGMLDIARYFEVEIVVAKETLINTAGAIIARKLTSKYDRENDAGTDIYELLDMQDEVSFPEKHDWIKKFDVALDLFDEQKWTDAERLFAEVIAMRDGNDVPASLYLQACEAKATSVLLIRRKSSQYLQK